MTAEGRTRLGPLGRRLLAAFLIVALSSIAVLTVAALVGTSRGLAAGQQAAREAAAAQVARAAGTAYQRAGGWAQADLGPAESLATQSGARLIVRDSADAVVSAPPGEDPARLPTGQGAGHGALLADVIVDGEQVGSVRLGFGTPVTGTAERIAWTWILLAAAAALVVSVAVAWFVTRRIGGPLDRLGAVAIAFSGGDRSARPAASDLAAPGELGQLARAFNTTAEAVTASEQARQRMSADIAHELRTPLAALQAGLEELADGYLEPDPARLAALHAQSVRLGRVVADLAELSRAESAGLGLSREPIDLGALVEDAVDAAAPTLTAAGLLVTEQITPDVVVAGDPDRLHQVVANLLSNTTRYCAAGATVTVTVGRADREAVLTVDDTGPGIPDADLPHVFDRLWRGRADSDTAGSGIGLAVVRELVSAHMGTVSAQSPVPGTASGSRFTVRLPLAA